MTIYYICIVQPQLQFLAHTGYLSHKDTQIHGHFPCHVIAYFLYLSSSLPSRQPPPTSTTMLTRPIDQPCSPAPVSTLTLNLPSPNHRLSSSSFFLQQYIYSPSKNNFCVPRFIYLLFFVNSYRISARLLIHVKYIYIYIYIFFYL